MRIKKTLLFFLSAIMPSLLISQQGSIKGRVFDQSNNAPVSFANIIIYGTTTGSTADLDGNFIFTGLQPGFVRLAVSAIGYETRSQKISR